MTYENVRDCWGQPWNYLVCTGRDTVALKAKGKEWVTEMSVSQKWLQAVNHKNDRHHNVTCNGLA